MRSGRLCLKVGTDPVLYWWWVCVAAGAKAVQRGGGAGRVEARAGSDSWPGLRNPLTSMRTRTVGAVCRMKRPRFLMAEGPSSTVNAMACPRAWPRVADSCEAAPWGGGGGGGGGWGGWGGGRIPSTAVRPQPRRPREIKSRPHRTAGRVISGCFRAPVPAPNVSLSSFHFALCMSDDRKNYPRPEHPRYRRRSVQAQRDALLGVQAFPACVEHHRLRPSHHLVGNPLRRGCAGRQCHKDRFGIGLHQSLVDLIRLEQVVAAIAVLVRPRHPGVGDDESAPLTASSGSSADVDDAPDFSPNRVAISRA